MDETTTAKVTMLVQMPVNGSVLPLSELNRLYPAPEFNGIGVAVIPEGNVINAPITGTIKDISSTLHSMTIVAENGLEILVHLGLETKRLEGRGIASYVKVGEKVEAGNKIIYFDREYVSARTTLTTPIIILNPSIMKEFEKNISIHTYVKKFKDTLMVINFEKVDGQESQAVGQNNQQQP